MDIFDGKAWFTKFTILASQIAIIDSQNYQMVRYQRGYGSIPAKTGHGRLPLQRIGRREQIRPGGFTP
jgi:hypothetical protein